MSNFTKNELVVIYNTIHRRQEQFKIDMESINRLESIKIKTMEKLSKCCETKEYGLTKFGDLTCLKELWVS